MSFEPGAWWATDFGALPPEINSGRMYAGPGSEPLMVAATAWDELAAELSAAAGGYGSVISALSSAPWVGPASAAMVSAVMPYVGWLSAVAAQAEQTATQARAAAAAYETAFAMTVPPPEITANRVLLMKLVATNFFGQNIPAIAATEAQYGEMWAQDTAAMYAYAGSSAVASELLPFKAPTDTTTADAMPGQTIAVAQATTTPAGNSAQTTAATSQQLISAVAISQVLPQLSPSTTASNSSTIPVQVPNWLNGLPTPSNNWLGLTPANYTTVFKQTLQAHFAVGIANFGYGIGQQLTFGAGTTAGTGGAWYATPQFVHLGLSNLAGGPVSAGAGQAGKVGMLSVPPTWAVSPEAVGHSATQMAGVNYTHGSPHGVSGLLRGLPVGSGAGRHSAGFTHRYGLRQSMISRPPSAG